MWTRARWLSVAEIAGFAATAAGIGTLAGQSMGMIAGTATGAIVAGCATVYLANAYAFTADEDDADAER